MEGTLPPHIQTPIPGPESVALVDILARRECPAITARRARRASTLGVADVDPIVWREAVGANVWDVDGNRLVDLTSGFGVALAGHRDPAIVAAAHRQTDTLLHAMGDAYPDVARIELLDRLARVAPPTIEHAILGLSGADAIDAAIKTAVLASGRTGVLVFEGSYHGLSLGTVPMQAYRAAFSDPFRAILHPDVHTLPFGASPKTVSALIDAREVGLVLVEPIQGRGGIRVAPAGWLEQLRAVCTQHGALLALDEIQCGLGRTGEIWGSEVIPDLLCVGKALGGGFPISACLGTVQAMSAWGASQGEAIHTQTFLGHPVGCATANAFLQQLPEITRRSKLQGALLRRSLEGAGFTVQGKGMMLGVQLPAPYPVSQALLSRGFICFPAGIHGEVLALTPPCVLSDIQIDSFVHALVEVA